MPPTEATLLTTVLLHPAPLPTVLSLESFKAAFPPALRKHPHVPHLYRSLQHRRALALDLVRRNMAAEARRGISLRRDVARQARRDARGDGGDGMREVEREWRELVGEGDGADVTNTSGRRPEAHTLETIVPALEAACRDVEAEAAALEAETQQSVQELSSIVGDLSDLRYGRFPKDAEGQDLLDEAMDALENLPPLRANEMAQAAP